MKYTDFVSYIRKQTKTNSTTFSDADIVLYANIAKEELSRAISTLYNDYFGVSMKQNLEAGVRNYTFETDILNRIKYVEANICPTFSSGVITVNDWQKLTAYNLNQLGFNTDEDSIEVGMADLKNGYHIFGNQLFILSADPIIDVTDGLVLWADVYPSDITTTLLSTTDDMSTPLSTIETALPKQVHELWARKVIMMFKEAQDRPMAFTQNEQNWKADLVDCLSEMSKNDTNQIIYAKRVYNDGSQY